MAVNSQIVGQELRLLLVGRSGCGKSSTGNTILDKKQFYTSIFGRSATSTATVVESVRFGRKVVVVDTPGFFDTEKSNDEISREIFKIFGYLQQGFHALIFVMGVGRFTEECVRTKDLFFETFGEGVAKYTVIVITHYDVLKGERVGKAEYLAQSAREYKDFQALCGRRVVFFNNKGSQKEKDRGVAQLFGLVDGIGRSNIRPCFTNIHMRIVRAYCRLEKNRSVLKIDRAKRALQQRARQTFRAAKTVHGNSVQTMQVFFSPSLQHTHNTQRSVPKIKPKSVPHPTQRHKQEELHHLYKKLPPIEPCKHSEPPTEEDRSETKAEITEDQEGHDGELEPETTAILEELIGEECQGSDEYAGSPVPSGPIARGDPDEETETRHMMNDKFFFERLLDFFKNLF